MKKFFSQARFKQLLFINLYFTLLCPIKIAALNSPNKENRKGAHTIIMYMGARSNLAPFAGSNLSDIAHSLKGTDINVIVQWDQPGKKGAYRYKITNGLVNLEQYAAVKDPSNIKQNFIDFIEYAAKKFPDSEKYSLGLWNHGTGPVEPPFGDPLRAFLNYRDMIDGNPARLEDFLTTTKKISDMITSESEIKRGILFDEDNHCFLSNRDLREALQYVTSKNVLNKKFETILMDACFMGATETMYQIKDFAQYCTGSEDLILAYGYPYGDIISNLVKNPGQGGRELVSKIVSYFDSFYKNKTQLYTLSAIDLKKIDELKSSIDDMCSKTLECMQFHGSGIVKPIVSARKSCQEFSSRVFIDLHSFCQQFIVKLLTNPQNLPAHTALTEKDAINIDDSYLRSKKYPERIIQLFCCIKNVLKSIESTVISSCCSKYLGLAKGLSIYFPTTRNIDQSYQRNEFCKDESGWYKLLTTILDQA